MTHVKDETKTNKFFRFLHGLAERALKGSLDTEQFTLVGQILLDKGVRAKNLIDYVANGCPKVDYSQRAPKAKALLVVKSSTTVNSATALVTSPTEDGLEALWVDSDLARFVNLGPCEDDERPLQSLFTLPRAMSDGIIADNVGGLATLTARKATLGQLVREVTLARSGQKGIFKKGQYYLLYLEGAAGSLVAVSVCWSAIYSRWRVRCYPFDQDGEWFLGSQVFGN